MILQDKWLWALKFFALADLATLHPAQLLSAILPALFAVETHTDRPVAAHAFLAAAKECVQATVQQHCSEQHSSVRSMFEELMDGPPAPLLMEIVSSQTDCGPSMRRKRSPVRGPRCLHCRTACMVKTTNAAMKSVRLICGHQLELTGLSA